MAHSRDLYLSLVAVAVAVVAVYYDLGAVRTVFGLLFILFFPGYALIAALFPRKDDIDGIERLALSLGLSIAVVPLIGLGLNYTPWGIRLNPILVSISLFTVLCLIGAFLRRRMFPEEERFVVSLPEDTGLFSGTRLDKALSVILVISIVAAVGMLVYVIVTPKVGERFTEFYILGPEGKAADYPTEYTLGESKELIIGVVNREHAVAQYRIDVVLHDDLLYEEELTLSHEETWEHRVAITPTITGEEMKLQFLLYKDGEQYRDLHLWVTVK